MYMKLHIKFSVESKCDFAFSFYMVINGKSIYKDSWIPAKLMIYFKFILKSLIISEYTDILKEILLHFI